MPASGHCMTILRVRLGAVRRRPRRAGAWVCGIIAASIVTLMMVVPASAEDAWNPFLKRDEPRRGPRQVAPEPSPPMPPMEGRTWWGSDRPAGASSSPGGYSAPPWASSTVGPADRAPSDASGARPPAPGAVSSSVERDTLPPLPDTGGAAGPSPKTPDPSRPPFGSSIPPVPVGPSARSTTAWSSLKVADAEALLTSMTMPPRSPTLAGLWRQLWVESGGELQSGPAERAHALAVRLEVLYRSGMLLELQKAMQDIPVDTRQQPLIGLLVARSLIGIGQHADGCQVLKASAGREPPLPAHLKPEVTLLAGYCAAVAGNTGGVELATALAREQGADNSVALQALDQVAQGGKGRIAIPKHVSLTDFRFLDISGAIDQRQAIERGDPPVLALFALGSEDKALRIVAAEQAVLMNVLPAVSLADAYRFAETARIGSDPVLRRAAAFRAAAAGGGPRDLALLLEDVRGAGLLRPVAQALDTSWDTLRPSPELAPAADAVIEALVLAGRLEAARAWAGSAGTAHWLVLIDIADAGVRSPHEAILAHIQRLALSRRVKPEALHRLVTVLNALDMQVPLPLWEAASASPQPTGGYLPDTGVLTSLQAASKARDLPRTVLLTIKALGPEGAEAANLLALDDAIRALKRAGFETQARQLAVEALLGSWPRRS